MVERGGVTRASPVFGNWRISLTGSTTVDRFSPILLGFRVCTLGYVFPELSK